MRKLPIEILYRATIDGKPSVTLILPDNLSFLERQAIAEAVLTPLPLSCAQCQLPLEQCHCPNEV